MTYAFGLDLTCDSKVAHGVFLLPVLHQQGCPGRVVENLGLGHLSSLSTASHPSLHRDGPLDLSME